MTIHCENCGAIHDLDPPSWVASSGRSFRFRCSTCGHSQSVPYPGVSPSPAGAALVSRTAPTEPPSPWATADDLPGGRDMRLSVTPASDRRGGPSFPGFGRRPPSGSPLSGPRRAETAPPAVSTPGAADRVGTPGSGGLDHGQDLYLKQNGQVYAVRDWETLRRWIVERRVDAADLVSIGGVRWEPVGSRTDLAPLLPADAWSTIPSMAPAAAAGHPTPAFLAESPFHGGDAWTDDDADGIPVGLPPLAPIPEEVLSPDGVSRTATPRAPSANPVDTRDYAPDHGWEDDGWEPNAGDVETVDAVGWTATYGSDEGPVDPMPMTTRGTTPAWTTPAAAPSPSYAAVDSQTDPTVHFEATPSVARTPQRARSPVAASRSPGLASHAATPGLAGHVVIRRGWEDSEPGDVEYDESPSFRGGPTPARSPGYSSLREPALAPKPVPADPSGFFSAGSSAPADPVEFPFDPEWEDELSPALRPVSGVLLVGAGVTLLAVAGVALVAFWPSALGPRPDWLPGGAPVAVVEAGAPAEEPHPPAAMPVAEPVQPAAEEAPRALRPTHATSVELSPVAVEPMPVPPKAPVRAPDSSMANLLKRGWELADGDRAKAALLFQKALALDADSDEAHYGLGYVRLMQGRTGEAAPHLCAARTATEEDIRVDVRGLIENHGIRCQ